MRRDNFFPVYGIRMNAAHEAYLIDTAEYILKVAPRDPIIVTARSIDNYARYQPYAVTKRHLPHVDPTKPGIMGEVTPHGRRSFRIILEGHHRMERNRLERTNWSCFLLTRYETWLVSAPVCKHCKGVLI